MYVFSYYGSSLFGGCGGPEKGRLVCVWLAYVDLFWTGVLGDRLCAFADRVLGKLAR